MFSYDYEPTEPTFDDEGDIEARDPDDLENADGTTRIPDGDGEAHTNGVNGDRVVTVGDPNTQVGKKNAVVGLREKRIPDNKRSTTPYMTKYERARVLGTRALQIRYAEIYGASGWRVLWR